MQQTGSIAGSDPHDLVLAPGLADGVLVRLAVSVAWQLSRFGEARNVRRHEHLGRHRVPRTGGPVRLFANL